jgi:hypothetical protein
VHSTYRSSRDVRWVRPPRQDVGRHHRGHRGYRHRLRFDPPFHARSDTKPRIFWDAVQVRTDLGVTGVAVARREHKHDLAKDYLAKTTLTEGVLGPVRN